MHPPFIHDFTAQLPDGYSHSSLFCFVGVRAQVGPILDAEATVHAHLAERLDAATRAHTQVGAWSVHACMHALLSEMQHHAWREMYACII